VNKGMSNHNIEAVKKAVEYCGTMQKLADQIGVHRMTVAKWVYGRASPSQEACIKMERVTNKEVMRWEIRQDKEW
jgi:DNA-binding transcriptional regulator YdaS (Cro superfamily)